MDESIENLGGLRQIEKSTLCYQIIQIDDFRRLEALAASMDLYKKPGHYERQIKHQAEGRRLVYIAVDDDCRDCGYCVLNWKPKYAPFKAADIPEIQDLNVLPEKRRRGIATSLISHCESLAKRMGFSQMGIGVGLSASFGPAQRLYVKLGYQPDGVGINYDRIPVQTGEFRPVDDQLCLMLLKTL